MNSEIPFARAQNQLFAAKIAIKEGNFNMHVLILFSLLADLLPNSNTPSRVSECFFKQISFHAKFTSFVEPRCPEQVSSFPAYNRR